MEVKFNRDLFVGVRVRIDSDEIKGKRPLGTVLQCSLDQTRHDIQGWAVGEEEDYCNLPLAQERVMMLEPYITHLSIEPVDKIEEQVTLRVPAEA